MRAVASYAFEGCPTCRLPDALRHFQLVGATLPYSNRTRRPTAVSHTAAQRRSCCSSRHPPPAWNTACRRSLPDSKFGEAHDRFRKLAPFLTVLRQKSATSTFRLESSSRFYCFVFKHPAPEILGVGRDIGWHKVFAFCVHGQQRRRKRFIKGETDGISS